MLLMHMCLSDGYWARFDSDVIIMVSYARMRCKRRFEGPHLSGDTRRLTSSKPSVY